MASLFSAKCDTENVTNELSLIFDPKRLEDRSREVEAIEAALARAREAIEAQKKVISATKWLTVLVIRREVHQILRDDPKRFIFRFEILRIPEQYAGATDYDISRGQVREKAEGRGWQSRYIVPAYVVSKYLDSFEDAVVDGRTVQSYFDEKANWARLVEELNKVLDAPGRSVYCKIDRIILDGGFRYVPEARRKLGYEEREALDKAGKLDKTRYEKDLKLLFQKCGVAYPYPDNKQA